MIRRTTILLLLAPAVVLVVLVLIGPVAATGGLVLGSGRAADIYARFFASSFNRDVVLRTLSIAAQTTAVSLVLGFVAAYTVARAPARAKSLLVVAAVFPILTSTVVRAFAFIVILGRNGVANASLMHLGVTSEPLPLLYSQPAVVFGMAYLFVPLMILSLVGVLESIDPDLSRAAASLGAGATATFRQVTLPLATPGLIVGAVLVFTGAFTSFATPQLLGGDRQTVLATLLYQKAMTTFDWTGAATIATIMVAITLVVVIGMTTVARRLNPAAA